MSSTSSKFEHTKIVHYLPSSIGYSHELMSNIKSILKDSLSQCNRLTAIKRDVQWNLYSNYSQSNRWLHKTVVASTLYVRRRLVRDVLVCIRWVLLRNENACRQNVRDGWSIASPYIWDTIRVKTLQKNWYTFFLKRLSLKYVKKLTDEIQEAYRVSQIWRLVFTEHYSTLWTFFGQMIPIWSRLFWIRHTRLHINGHWNVAF